MKRIAAGFAIGILAGLATILVVWIGGGFVMFLRELIPNEDLRTACLFVSITAIAGAIVAWVMQGASVRDFIE